MNHGNNGSTAKPVWAVQRAQGRPGQEAPDFDQGITFRMDLAARVVRFYARNRALLEEARARVATEETETGKDTAP